MTHRYDWSKLDAGWTYTPADGAVYESISCRNSRGYRVYFSVADLRDGTPSCGTDHPLWPEALTQFAKCRVRDTEPAPAVPQYAIAERFFDDVHKLMNEPYDHGSMIAAYGAPPPPKCEVKAIGLSEDFTMWSYQPPPPPWRRGPLASWTLVNISAHDGRLTVVIKRGRGELIDETGPDDEALWERLSAKVVEFDKAKHAPK